MGGVGRMKRIFAFALLVFSWSPRGTEETSGHAEWVTKTSALATDSGKPAENSIR
jgi:hypothetical protein